MKKYVMPLYEAENVNTSDVIMASMIITDLGTSTLGTITGEKAGVATSFENLLLGKR